MRRGQSKSKVGGAGVGALVDLFHASGSDDDDQFNDRDKSTAACQFGRIGHIQEPVAMKKNERKLIVSPLHVVKKKEGALTVLPLHRSPEYDNSDDLEAACRRQVPSTPILTDEAARNEFELNKDRSPAEWMRVGDTTSTRFLWFTVLVQIASACCSAFYLASRKDQLAWKTGCWGRWTSLADAQDVEFVEFDTHIGWRYYGKGDKLGLLSEVSRRAAVVGNLAGGAHTLAIFVSCAFLMFSLSALWLSHGGLRCARRGSRSQGGEEGVPSKPPAQESPLVLARDCHRWMFLMAAIDILGGLWCLGVGCAGFYLVIVRDFTEGLEEVVSAWGEEVSCTRAKTSPRWGFFVNGVSVLLLAGGGIVSLYKTHVSNRELNEAVDLWKRDCAETAEMAARMAMIKKKEEYAAAVAFAAFSAAQSPLAIFERRSSENVGAGVATGAGAVDSDEWNKGQAGTTAALCSAIDSLAAPPAVHGKNARPGPSAVDSDLESRSAVSADDSPLPTPAPPLPPRPRKL